LKSPSATQAKPAVSAPKILINRAKDRVDAMPKPPEICTFAATAQPDLHVVPNVGHRSAPPVMAVLASAVHDGQATADQQHNRDEGNQ
jgi:hypothetical protein